MAKFEIKNRWNGELIFEIEIGNFRLAIEAAIKAKANLSYADLSSANLSSANLSSASLSSANLSSADLSYADLSSADLSSANLSSANLSYANLRYADLSSANLRYADLSSADLSSANLSSANLSSANLSYANLRYANLRYANLSYADLSSANLSSADLSYADLSYAKGIDAYMTTPLLMLLDQPGKIRAYKLVKPDGLAPFNGGLIYKIGKSYEVADANTDVMEHCAPGINVATLDWCMKEYQEGWRVLILEFEAKDIAAIPTATDGKFRLFRADVVGEKDLKQIGLVKKEKVSA